ncbi:MAG TPA: hypothetical protein VGI70_21185 [Polyangiales bacterium]|jgi:hypothetical protein
MNLRVKLQATTLVLLTLTAACGTDDPNSSGATGAAGSSSAGAAGTAAVADNCTTYCNLAVGKLCTGALQLYPDTASCLAGCAMIAAPGTVNDAAGNTLGCRIYHLTLANMNATNATTHCPHGMVVSAVCN